MESSQGSGGTTLMDLLPACSTAAAGGSSPGPAQSPSLTLGRPATTEKSNRSTLIMMIHSDTISAAKALNPVKTIPHRQKKPVLYAQLAQSIQELATTPGQDSVTFAMFFCDLCIASKRHILIQPLLLFRKNSQKQLVHHMFSKLVVYNSVDPSLAWSLLMLHQQCEDWNVLRYVYYYLARILSDSGAQGFSAGGGIPTPNWDALADIDAGGGVTRADVVPADFRGLQC